MANSDYTAEEIKLKVIKLLEKVNQLENQAKALTQQHFQDEETIRDQKNTIKTLQEQNKIVKLAGALPVSDEDKPAIKKKLANYIHEIDECIRLLGER